MQALTLRVGGLAFMFVMLLRTDTVILHLVWEKNTKQWNMDTFGCVAKEKWR